MASGSAEPAYPKLYARAREAVKRRVARWPSAYASAQVVRAYKALVKSKRCTKPAYTNTHKKQNKPLARWFREKWVDVLTMKPCGSVKTSLYYPVCRPERVARTLTTSQIVDAVTKKQRAKAATVTTYAW
jgi:hypothetical protein